MGFITNVSIFLSHTAHDTFVTRATDDGREDSARSIVTSESSFTHTGTIIDDQSLDFIFIIFIIIIIIIRSTTEAKHQMKSRLLLDVVVRQSAAVFELLTSEDQTLLIRRDSFLV